MMVAGRGPRSNGPPNGPSDEMSALKSHLSSVSAERNLLRDTLKSLKVRVRAEVEESLCHQAQEYESKLTEFQTVILELKKELARARNSKIIEEPEESVQEESVQTEEIQSPTTPPDDNNNRTPKKKKPENFNNTNSSRLDKLPPRCPPKFMTIKNPQAFSAELRLVSEEHEAIKRSLCEKEAELQSSRFALSSLAQERDFLRKKVSELEILIKSGSRHRPRRAERVTPRNLNERRNLAADLNLKSSELSGRVVEHLVRDTTDQAGLRELEGALGQLAQDRLKEFEIEAERLTSRCEHYRAQNDLLSLNLENSKAAGHRMQILLGKHESNNVALQIALNLSDQAIEAYDVLVALLESELGLLLANCRAAGIGGISQQNLNSETNLNDQEEGGGEVTTTMDMMGTLDIGHLLEMANSNRSTAEGAARDLLMRIIPENTSNCGKPWEDLSTGSQTLSSVSSGDENPHQGTSQSESDSQNQQFPEEEQKVREMIIQLKTERESVRNTVSTMEESWNLQDDLDLGQVDQIEGQNGPSLDRQDSLEARRMDLETAVLLQELMAMREERAELRAHAFLQEKEKHALCLRLDGAESVEVALRSTLTLLQKQIQHVENINKSGFKNKAKNDNDNGNNEKMDKNANELSSEHSTVDLSELVSNLEKVTKSSRERENEAGGIIEELKDANGGLVDALEGLKRKYTGRLRRMEEQLVGMMGKHSRQVRSLQERIRELEGRYEERSDGCYEGD